MFSLANYWNLVIWLLIAGALFLIVPKYEISIYGSKISRVPFVVAVVMTTPFVLWAAFRRSNFGDTGAYIAMYKDAPTSLGQISSYVLGQTKDKGFYLLMDLFKITFHCEYIPFFLLVAIIQIACLIHVYRKFSYNFWLSIFCFVMVDYLSYMHNGMRQFLAVAIIFSCFPLLIEKKYKTLICIILITSLIHMTALIFLPFIFIVQGKPWNIRTVSFIVAIILAVLFIDSFTGILTTAMENTQYASEISDLMADDGVNIMRVLFFNVPTFLSLIFKRRIERINNPVMNVCVNLSIVTTGFYIIALFTSGIYIGRIPIFFSLSNYILYPMLCEEIFEHKSARILEMGIAVVFFAFFYYQMHIAWGLL